MNKVNIKLSTLLFFVTTLMFMGCSDKAAKDSEEEGTPLEEAFQEISNIQGFEDWSKEAAEEYSGLGKVRAVIAPNSKARDKVLGILDEIPEELLCDEHRSGNNDKFIERYYIGKDADGESQMLYSVVGSGGADLFVILCSGADESKYRERVGKYK